jgi:hypothetical protein
MKRSFTRILAIEGISIFLALMFVTAFNAFGADSSGDVGTIPDWLRMIVTFVIGFPYVGPIVVEVLKWVGVIAAVMTGISSTVAAVLVALQKIGKATGFEAFAAWVQKMYDTVWPYIAWLSIYNVQRK